ncbi:MAG: hypothetical protein QNJ98_19595, partial [Planctomycetota bacterium]|nr:hypothetical protein [Planctomycetota bacterium]
FEPLLGQDLVDERELTAQRHLARVVEPGLPASGMTYASDEDLLPSFELAAQVHALVDDPLGFEIVRLSRFDPKRNRATLGFDVGYWGGDFSLICDTLIAPKWHPAPEEDYEALRVQTRRLNRHVLFDSEEAGWAFRHWYVQQPWAETEFEPGEIQVVRVDAIF